MTAAASFKDRVINSAERITKSCALRNHRCRTYCRTRGSLTDLPTQREPTVELIDDIRRFFVETGVTLDIKTDEGGLPIIIPIEEPLLQTAIMDDLLPRLSARFPRGHVNS